MSPPHHKARRGVSVLTGVVGGRRLPLGVGVAPALGGVLVWGGASGAVGEAE